MISRATETIPTRLCTFNVTLIAWQNVQRIFVRNLISSPKSCENSDLSTDEMSIKRYGQDYNLTRPRGPCQVKDVKVILAGWLAGSLSRVEPWKEVETLRFTRRKNRNQSMAMKYECQ